MKLFLSAVLISAPLFLYAWTGPTAAPPGNNVSAPVNVGSGDQFKPGVMGANIINIYGASQYLSFGNTTGASGFGIRNNAGILEYKNSGGAWAALGGMELTSTGLAEAKVIGSGSGYVNAAILLQANDASTNYRGLGIFMRQATSQTEWYAGTPYADADKYIIARKPSVVTHDTTTAQTASALVSVNSSGRLDVTSGSGNGGIISSGNYGGTGTAAYFPSGIWSNGASSWIYGTRYVNGAEVDTSAGTIRDAGGGWVRTYGGTGWYNGTYGGGWYMADTTWLRAYNNKSIYTAGIVRGDQYVAGASFCDASATYCSSAYGLWYVHTYYYSDKRLKKDIKDMSDDYGLGAIMKLRPVQFAWKDKTSSEKLGPQIGLIAQEVEQVIPEAVDTMPSKEITTADGTKETIENPKSVTYQNLVVPLIKSVQDLKTLNDAQQKEIDALKEQVKQLQSR